MEKKILDAEERVRKSGLTVRQTCEGLFLLLHAFLLGEGFVAVVVAEGSAPAGFAAPMRGEPLTPPTLFNLTALTVCCRAASGCLPASQLGRRGRLRRLPI